MVKIVTHSDTVISLKDVIQQAEGIVAFAKDGHILTLVFDHFNDPSCKWGFMPLYRNSGDVSPILYESSTPTHCLTWASRYETLHWFKKYDAFAKWILEGQNNG